MVLGSGNVVNYAYVRVTGGFAKAEAPECLFTKETQSQSFLPVI